MTKSRIAYLVRLIANGRVQVEILTDPAGIPKVECSRAQQHTEAHAIFIDQFTAR